MLHCRHMFHRSRNLKLAKMSCLEKFSKFSFSLNWKDFNYLKLVTYNAYVWYSILSDMHMDQYTNQSIFIFILHYMYHKGIHPTT